MELFIQLTQKLYQYFKPQRRNGAMAQRHKGTKAQWRKGVMAKEVTVKVEIKVKVEVEVKGRETPKFPLLIVETLRC
jgi:hypothetical protein